MISPTSGPTRAVLYLAGIKDLFNGELVGYAMSERMTRTLGMQALFGAAALEAAGTRT